MDGRLTARLPRTVVIGIRVPREIAEAWAIEAAERGTTVSAIVRQRALRGELEIVVPRGRPAVNRRCAGNGAGRSNDIRG